MGGRLALQFACRYPDHLSGLVLIGAHRESEIQMTEKIVRNGMQHRQIESELGVEGFYNEWQRLPIIATQQRIEPAIQTKMKANRLAQSIEGLANSMTHFGTGTMPDCWDILPN